MALHELSTLLADADGEETAFRRMRTIITARGGAELISGGGDK
jgi:hypothetical protein